MGLRVHTQHDPKCSKSPAQILKYALFFKDIEKEKNFFDMGFESNQKLWGREEIYLQKMRQEFAQIPQPEIC